MDSVQCLLCPEIPSQVCSLSSPCPQCLGRDPLGTRRAESLLVTCGSPTTGHPQESLHWSPMESHHPSHLWESHQQSLTEGHPPPRSTASSYPATPAKSWPQHPTAPSHKHQQPSRGETSTCCLTEKRQEEEEEEEPDLSFLHVGQPSIFVGSDKWQYHLPAKTLFKWIPKPLVLFPLFPYLKKLRKLSKFT